MSFAVTQCPSSCHMQRGASILVLVLFISAIFLTAIIAATFGHKFGYHKGYQASNNEFRTQTAGEEVTATNVKSLRLKAELLENKLQTAKQERDISLRNLAELRETQRELEVTNLQLQQVNDVFANTIRQRGGLDLQIIAAKIEPLPENAFEYRFDVAMLAEDGKVKSLKPELTLLDRDNLVEVPLDPSTYKIDGVTRIRGRFIMPKGFKPKQAKLILSADGQSNTQLYDWQFSKPVDDMPLSLADAPETDQRPISKDKE